MGLHDGILMDIVSAKTAMKRSVPVLAQLELRKLIQRKRAHTFEIGNVVAISSFERKRKTKNILPLTKLDYQV